MTDIRVHSLRKHRNLCLSHERNFVGGPCYAAFNGHNIQFVGDVPVEAPAVWDDVDTALYGKIDKIYRDLIVKAKGAPRYYDTAALSTCFLTSQRAPGTVYPGSTRCGRARSIPITGTRFR